MKLMKLNDFCRAVRRKLLKKAFLFMLGREFIMTHGDPEKAEVITF